MGDNKLLSYNLKVSTLADFSQESKDHQSYVDDVVYADKASFDSLIWLHSTPIDKASFDSLPPHGYEEVDEDMRRWTRPMSTIDNNLTKRKISNLTKKKISKIIKWRN